MRFYNRKKELGILKNLSAPKIAVVGRRRIGKTTLVEYAYKNRLLTLFIPAEKTEKEIISGWVDEYKDLNLPKVVTFKEFFEFVFFHMKNKVVFIDELQNSLKVNKSFIYDLQRILDKFKCSCIVSGSYIRTMKRIIENYKSPLFGRFDIIIKLKELDFKTVCEICADLGYGLEDSIKFYSVLGGIPKYYELIEKLKKIDFVDFVINMFVNYPRPLCEEVKTIIKEEFGKEHKIFFSILSSVSQGKNSLKEISDYVGREQTKITKYISLLKEDFEMLTRVTPLVGSSKKGIYAINSNIVKFWFSNIWKYQYLIEKGDERQLAAFVKSNLNSYIGSCFENMCKDLLKDIAPFKFTKIGKQWGKFKGEKGKNTYEIDIVALNERTNHILFAECKWQNNVNAEKILNELKEKSKYVEWPKGSEGLIRAGKAPLLRKESYAIFAKSFKRKIKGIYCLDLKDIEKVLKKK